MADAGKPRASERLDVPAQTALERRLLVAEDRPATKPDMSAPPPPPAALLGRLQDFLPAMARANAELAANPPPCMEEPGGGEGDEGEGGAEPHVELELACGVYELRDDAAVAAAERAIAGGGGPLVETYGGGSSDSDSSSSSSSSSDDDIDDGGEAASDAAEGSAPSAAAARRKPKKRAGIEELS